MQRKEKVLKFSHFIYSSQALYNWHLLTISSQNTLCQVSLLPVFSYSCKCHYCSCIHSCLCVLDSTKD